MQWLNNGGNKMNYEQINIATENAISTIRSEVAHGHLKYESDVFAFLSGYTRNGAIVFSLVWDAINQMVKEGKIERRF